MNDFSDHVRVHERVDDEHKAVLSELVLDARQANSFLRSHPRNIEDILSFAEMKDRLRLGKEQAHWLKRILRSVYSKWPGRAQESLASTFRELLGYAATREMQTAESYSPRGLSVVTTNYDLNTEWVLTEMGCAVKLGCSKGGKTFKVQRRGLYRQTDANAVPLFKLHGAVNWDNRQRCDDQC